MPPACCAICRDRPRYVNLMVLLRILCEITATVVLVGGLSDLLVRRAGR